MQVRILTWFTFVLVKALDYLVMHDHSPGSWAVGRSMANRGVATGGAWGAAPPWPQRLSAIS